jgi:hypothetical protein
MEAADGARRSAGARAPSALAAIRHPRGAGVVSRLNSPETPVHRSRSHRGRRGGPGLAGALGAEAMHGASRPLFV